MFPHGDSNFLSFQVKNSIESNDSYAEQDTMIRNLNKTLPEKTNTIIPLHHIMNHPSQWEAFLKFMIPDFVQEEGVWWKEIEQGIIFNDLINEKTTLKPHHFRSSTMVQVENYLATKWELCLKTSSSVPGGFYFLDNMVMDDQEECDTVTTVLPSTEPEIEEAEAEFDYLNENVELEVDKIQTIQPVIDCPITTTHLSTKTGKLLEQVLGPTELVVDFDSKRNKLKKHPKSSLYIIEYRESIARLEVILISKYNELKEFVSELEFEKLMSCSSLNIVVDNAQYKEAVNKLKILQILRTELKI